jgi:hypothetical protein
LAMGKLGFSSFPGCIYWIKFLCKNF